MREVIREVRRARRQLVIVTGAGVTRSIRFANPSWWQLVNDGLTSHAIPHTLAASPSLEELLVAAELVQNAMVVDKALWWEPLFGAIHANVVTRDVVDAIAALRVPVITLNYDGLYDTLSGATALVPEILGSCPTARSGEVPTLQGVLHLHGWHELPERVVLGSTSYQRISRALLTQASLRAALAGRRILFIGCGPDTVSDHNLGPILNFLEHIAPGGGGRHWLVGYPRELVGCTSRVIEPVVLSDYTQLVPFLRAIGPVGRRTAPPLPATARPLLEWTASPPDQSTMSDGARGDAVAAFAGMCRGLSDALEVSSPTEEALRAILHVPKWFRAFGVDDHLLEVLERRINSEAASLALAEVCLDGGRSDDAYRYLRSLGAPVPAGLRDDCSRVATHLAGLAGFPLRTARRLGPRDPRLDASTSRARVALFRGLERHAVAWWEGLTVQPVSWADIRNVLRGAGDQVGQLWTWIAEGRAALRRRSPDRLTALQAASEARGLARRLRHPATPWTHLLEGDVLAAQASAASQAMRHYDAALAAFRHAGDDAGVREARASIARMHLFAAHATNPGGAVSPIPPLHWDEVTSGIYHLNEEDFTMGAGGRWGRGPRSRWRDDAVRDLRAMLS